MLQGKKLFNYYQNKRPRSYTPTTSDFKPRQTSLSLDSGYNWFLIVQWGLIATRHWPSQSLPPKAPMRRSQPQLGGVPPTSISEALTFYNPSDPNCSRKCGRRWGVAWASPWDCVVVAIQIGGACALVRGATQWIGWCSMSQFERLSKY